jgi:hypothetical protein
MTDDGEKSKSASDRRPQEQAAADRRLRSAEALRANLRKRRGQSQARQASDKKDDAQP